MEEFGVDVHWRPRMCHAAFLAAAYCTADFVTVVHRRVAMRSCNPILGVWVFLPKPGKGRVANNPEIERRRARGSPFLLRRLSRMVRCSGAVKYATQIASSTTPTAKARSILLKTTFPSVSLSPSLLDLWAPASEV